MKVEGCKGYAIAIDPLHSSDPIWVTMTLIPQPLYNVIFFSERQLRIRGALLSR